MPLPILPVPAFPDVPNVPGVPPVVRSAISAANRLTGTFNGLVDASGGVTGAVSGVLSLASGAAQPILGTIQGALDAAGNLRGVLSGAVRGSVQGVFSGPVNALTGVLSGAVDLAIDQLGGDLFGLGGTGLVTQPTTDPFVWGIFDSEGFPVLVGDTVLALGNIKDYRLANYPVEGGGFEQYNKVEVPFEVRIRFAKGGTLEDRTEFLATLDAVSRSLDLYTVATPERTYQNVNVVRYDVQRSTEGISMLIVDVGVLEVRNTATIAFTNSQQPDGATPVNAGPVQPQTPTAPQIEAFDAAIPGPPTIGSA